MDLFAHATGDPMNGIPASTWVVEHIELQEGDPVFREDIRTLFQYAFAALAGESVRVTFSDEFPATPEG